MRNLVWKCAKYSKLFNSLITSKLEPNPSFTKMLTLSYQFSNVKMSLCTCPAVKMATLLSFWPRKAMLLVGKLFSCSAFPVARSKIQYRTQFPVFKTACTPSETYKCRIKIVIHLQWSLLSTYQILQFLATFCRCISFNDMTLRTQKLPNAPKYFILLPFTTQVLTGYEVCQLKKLQNCYLWNPHLLLIFLFFQVYKAF